MSADRKTKPMPEEENKELKKKNRALQKRVKELEAERDVYIHAANALYSATITPEQIAEWDREDEPGGDLRDLLKKWEKDMKARKR
jgi:hypothetical protein